MTTLSSSFFFASVFVALLNISMPISAALNVYVSAPGHQSAPPPNYPEANTGKEYQYYTETMQSVSTLGNLFAEKIPGTAYTANFNTSDMIKNNDQYGGYGTGTYLSVNGANRQVTLTMGESVNYFSFYWTAGDAGNILSFYNDADQLIGVFTTNYLMNMLKNDSQSKIVAEDGSSYYTGYYYGKPNAAWPGDDYATQNVAPNMSTTRENSSEPYAFIHFINEEELTAYRIKKVVFSQSNGSGFESDNHTIRLRASDLDNSDLIFVKAVPEPQALGMLLSGMLSLMLRRKRSS